MAAKLRIRNWDRWQSYRRDRGQPPWIKVHREVMRNIEWVGMTDAQRGQLVAIWLLAADHDGAIPASPALVQKLCFMSEPPDLDFFIDQGFIESDANMTPDRRQTDAKPTNQNRGRGETETEAEKEQGALPRTPDRFDDFWDGYPVKREKKRAREAWKRKKLDQIADEILADIARRKLHDPQWLDGFIPHPSTYINGERWQDEIKPRKRDGPKTGDHARLTVIEQAKRMRAVR